MRAVVLGTALVVWGVTASPTAAAIPHLVRYQGQAVDSQGVPLQGPYNLTFRLYGVATGGTPVWEEPQTGVLLAQGHFSVLLGQMTPFPTGFDWSQPLWLGVQVNAEAELAPRQQITSVPLALRAETAEQLAVAVTTSTITDDAKRLVPSGAIILWAGAGCPAGYTRLSSFDGALLKAGASFSNPTAAGAGELPAHSHAFSGTTSTDGNHKHNLVVEVDTGGETALYSTYPNQPMADGTRYIDAAGSHAHSVSGTASSSGSAQVATVLLCQKD